MEYFTETTYKHKTKANSTGHLIQTHHQNKIFFINRNYIFLFIHLPLIKGCVHHNLYKLYWSRAEIH